MDAAVCGRCAGSAWSGTSADVEGLAVGGLDESMDAAVRGGSMVVGPLETTMDAVSSAVKGLDISATAGVVAGLGLANGRARLGGKYGVIPIGKPESTGAV